MSESEKKELYVTIIRENEKAIRRIALFYCRDKNWLSDLHQEIGLNIWLSLDRFRNEAQISTWVYKIALNVSIFFSKQRKLESNIIFYPDILDLNRADNPHTDQEIERLYHLLEYLNPLDKAVILLYLDKKKHTEIAEILGISVTNTGTKISRTIEKLKKLHCNITIDENS